MIDDIRFKIINEKGIQETYIIIDRFEKNNKNFIIYQEENGNEIYASFYELVNDKMKIIEIEKDEDYDIVDEYLESL